MNSLNVADLEAKLEREDLTVCINKRWQAGPSGMDDPSGKWRAEKYLCGS